MKKGCFILLLCFIANILADIDLTFTAPKNPGSALIIYCGLGYNVNNGKNEYSQGAMETFRAALAQDANLILHPSKSRSEHDLFIPVIDPKLTSVNILNITPNTNNRLTASGIDSHLKQKFYVQNPTVKRIEPNGDTIVTIDDFEFNITLFKKLYDDGNPLSYWSQVYDLRFVDEYSEDRNRTTAATITDKDMAFFKEHLKTGGTLFIQDEYNGFRNRNYGVGQVITNFTSDVNYNYLRVVSGNSIYPSTFDGSLENFDRDFNNLSELVSSYSMRWEYAGGIPDNLFDGIVNGYKLVKNGSTIVIAAWDTKKMNPEIGNGRLIVSYDINAWSDYEKGKISRTTFALIQNIYDLMDGSKQYTVSKRFEPDEIGIGVVGECVITVNNNGNYLIENIVVEDPLNPCLEFISSTPQHTTKNGNTLIWNLGDIGGRNKKEIRFQYRITDLERCAD
jgi:uncharacterized repeat protein (TIGR01451 family)